MPQYQIKSSKLRNKPHAISYHIIKFYSFALQHWSTYKCVFCSTHIHLLAEVQWYHITRTQLIYIGLQENMADEKRKKKKERKNNNQQQQQ